MKFQQVKYTLALLIAASASSRAPATLASSELDDAIPKKQLEDIVTMDHYSTNEDTGNDEALQNNAIPKKNPEDIVSIDHYSIEETDAKDEAHQPDDGRRLSNNAEGKGLRGAGNKRKLTTTCSKQKKVSMYKFCIEGDCDAGAEGEHRLKIDGHWLYNHYRDFREGQCHSINYPAKTVDAWKSLTVGTEEHDTFSENDSYFATMPASSWYSETCETYEIILSKEHTSESKESMCWEISGGGSVKGIDLGLTATRCSEWTKPSESFLWYLKVEPADYYAGQDNPIGWYDIDGPQYNCEWYSVDNRCSVYGDYYANFGKTAKQACKVCGGGTGKTDGSTFKIRSKRDGNYIDVRGCHDMADVYYAPDADTDRQRFYWGPDGQLYNKECGKVIDIYKKDCSDGTNLVMWPAKSSNKSNQQWKVDGAGELESYQCSGKVIDHASHGTVLLWHRHGGTNQQWEFV